MHNLTGGSFAYLKLSSKITLDKEAEVESMNVIERCFDGRRTTIIRA